MDFSLEQDEIIQHREGHSMIMASPGSGKTTTMIARIIALLLEGVDPKRITVLMFNTSAQEEFLKKLKINANGAFPYLPEVRTYHSLAYHLCDLLMKKNELPLFKLETNQKRYELLAMSAIESAMDAKPIKELKSKNSKIVESFVSYIDIIKATMLSPKDALEMISASSMLSFFPRAFDIFEEKRKSLKIRFFSDLLFDVVSLLQKRSDLCDWISNKKDYVIVDEYQDTNFCQSILLKIISGTRANVMVVGDVDQAIYEWRGGEPRLMLEQFAKDFHGTTYYSLSHTFRYGHELALAANHVISNNKERHNTLCSPINIDKKTSVNLWGYGDFGEGVLCAINEQKNKNTSLNDISVLIRLYSHAIPVELSLLKAGIPCSVSGNRSSLESKEVLALIYLIELASGNFINLSEIEKRVRFEALLKFPHTGLNSDMIEQIASKLAKLSKNFGGALRELCPKTMQPYRKRKIYDRSDAWTSIEFNKLTLNKNSTHKILKDYIIYSDLYAGFKSISLSSIEESESIAKCELFCDFIKQNDGLPSDVFQFIKSILKTSHDYQAKSERVLITSIHKAKGLEWKTVIMPGLIDGKFPYQLKEDDTSNMESERRLFYVGMTRAIDNLYLITSQNQQLNQFLNGKNIEHNSKTTSSRFIFETNLVLSKKVSNLIELNSTSALKKIKEPLIERYLNALAS